MQDNNNVLSNISDDEEDLESLRLAALQSLKRPASSTTNETPYNPLSQNAPKKFAKNPNKRGRGFYGNSRQSRNGMFNRVRNTNLIAVQTIQTEQEVTSTSSKSKKLSDDAIPKLILPQDRYANKVDSSDERGNEASSKFDRYNDSADSNSESEDEPASQSDSPKKVERSTSLEALMQELENELNEEKKVEPKPKVKKVKKVSAKITPVVERSPPVIKVKQKSPVPVKEAFVNTAPVNYPIQSIPVAYVEPSIPVMPPVHSIPYSNLSISYDPYGYSNVRPFEVLSPSQPQRYERPVSPIAINTNILSTISAPLSPRSAAFVLQNREIIERRKKSPRCSYSRSPSPEFRRNPSPRYRSKSPSPLRNRRNSPSRNIRRLSPNLRRFSPSARSQLSPRLRRSPQHQRSSIRERLGDTQPAERVKSRQSPSVSLSLSPSPERDLNTPIKDLDENQDSSSVDPVLEARRRKFEEKGSVVTEGIIRLKPKTDQEEQSPEQTGEEEEWDDEGKDDEIVDETYIEFDKKVDLFSDEESDDENEGRFKLSSEPKPRDITILPFSQLLNGTNKGVPSDTVLCDPKKSYTRDREHREKGRTHNPRDRDRLSRNRRILDKFREDRNRTKANERQRSRSPVTPEKTIDSLKERKPKLKDNVTKTLSVKKLPIEIKIRNPSKYEGIEEGTKDDDSRDKKSSSRKVKVAKDSSSNEAESSKVLEYEEEDDDMFSKSDGDGDLRAQLSRKRAERQSKLPKVEEMSSRLLKNALESAVFKKVKKSKKSKEQTALVDGKLPIHLRLGLPGSTDAFTDTKSHKISRKRIKNRGNLEQV